MLSDETSIKNIFYPCFAMFYFIDSSSMFLSNIIPIISHPPASVRHPIKNHTRYFDNGSIIIPVMQQKF